MLGLVFTTILAMSATGGILLLLIYLLRPVTSRAFSAAWHYYVSLAALAFLLIPVGFIPGKFCMDISPGFVYPMETNFIFADKMQDDTVKAAAEMAIHHANQNIKIEALFHTDDLLYYLFWLWLLGMTIFTAYKGKQYLKFRKKLLETSLPVEQNNSIYQIYQECRLKIGVRQKITLLCNESINSPMVIGLFQTFLLIPKIDMDERELQLILRHELIHCKRKDLWFKAAALFANAVHWFNPLVHKMLRDINEFCEISCDEAVVRDMNMKDRHFYGETILNVLSRALSKQEAISPNLCESLCESEKGIKRRLTFIMKKKHFSKKMTAVSIAVFLVMCIAGSVLAYMLAPSDENLAGNSDWQAYEGDSEAFFKTYLDEIDSKALFADIVANNKTGENADDFQSALEQFLAVIAQNQKTPIDEQAIEVLTLPVPDGKITSPYGKRYHPITKECIVHTGIDYAQKAGGDIVAARGGKVIATQEDLGFSVEYGNYLIIVHNDGTACLYTHCSALMADTGDWVNKGDKIAEIGSTGMSTGPHCHFEFRINGKPVDPIPYLALAE